MENKILPWKLCKEDESGNVIIVKRFISDYEAEIYADENDLGDDYFIEQEVYDE